MPLHTNLASTDHFVLIRRRIHANPELGLAETQTAALVAQELEHMGLEVTRNAGGTSVVTTMDSGKPSKTVALRAELDTLSSLEKPMSSKNHDKDTNDTNYWQGC